MRRNACFNREPLKTRVMVQDGWNQDGNTRTPRMSIIPDPMTKHCNYAMTDLGKVDPLCMGCSQKERNDA